MINGVVLSTSDGFPPTVNDGVGPSADDGFLATTNNRIVLDRCSAATQTRCPVAALGLRQPDLRVMHYEGLMDDIH